MNVSFSDGVKTSTRKQNDVGFCVLGHYNFVFVYFSKTEDWFSFVLLLATAVRGEVHLAAAVSSLEDGASVHSPF